LQNKLTLRGGQMYRSIQIIKSFPRKFRKHRLKGTA
jgi:hypothetical protein